MIRPDLRGAKAVADHLGVSVRTMWTYVTDEPPLPLFKLGGTCVANRIDLNAWMARKLRSFSDPAPVPAAPPRPKIVERRRIKPRPKKG